MVSGITAVIINYNTPDLTRRSVEALRRWHPELPLLLVDNGSDAATVSTLGSLRDASPRTTTLHLNASNIFHGPAMDQAIRMTESPFVFILDSDCEIVRPGLLEAMSDIAQANPAVYAVGHRVGMDGRGFDEPLTEGSIPYIRPYCMLLRRETYLSLPPFVHHGAPCLENMRVAATRGCILEDFPVLQYAVHEGRGTAGRFGYHLGVRGKINHALHILGFDGKKIPPFR
jgi:glycosyltransferase involved in cell wall biosynthesis